jgi:DNA-binding NtrC family response regulator
VLIVSSDPLHCVKTQEIAARLGMQSVQCASLTDARTRIAEQSFQLVLCSDDLPDCNLRTALRVLTSSTGDVPVIVLSQLADWDAYRRAPSAGAFDYIACPPDPVETEGIPRLALALNSPRAGAPGSAA